MRTFIFAFFCFTLLDFSVRAQVNLTCTAGSFTTFSYTGANGSCVNTAPTRGNVFYAVGSNCGAANNNAVNVQISCGCCPIFNGDCIRYTNTNTAATTDVFVIGGITYNVTIIPANNSPTNITLTNASIAENQPIASPVGDLSTTDPDANQTFSYSLVSGQGSTDNALFSIVGAQLRTAAVFDFETKNGYSIRVRTRDQGNLTFEKSFTITVTNVNEAPTDVRLLFTAKAAEENQPINSAVALVSAVDPDDPDGTGSYSFSLVSGQGSDDNSSFIRTGTLLRTAAVFDFETKNSYSIRLRVGDSGGLTFEKSLTIAVGNVNENPSVLNAIVNQHARVGEFYSFSIPANTFTDPETPNALSLTATGLPTGLILTGNTISGTPQQRGVSQVTIRATDPGSLSVSTGFSLTVTQLTIVANTTAICPGGLVQLDAQGCDAPGQVVWSTGQSGNSIQIAPQSTTLISATCLSGGDTVTAQPSGQSQQKLPKETPMSFPDQPALKSSRED